MSNLDDVIVFHMGTALKNSSIVTNGGRVLTIVAVDNQLLKAVSKATLLCSSVSFDGAHYRKDIGQKGVSR